MNDALELIAQTEGEHAALAEAKFCKAAKLSAKLCTQAGELTHEVDLRIAVAIFATTYTGNHQTGSHS